MKSSLTEWLMGHYGREEVTRETGLARITSALGPLIQKLSSRKIITIAGTNGKGETTLWLSQELGHRSHCVWISPHVERITERFRDEKGEISEDELRAHIEASHEEVTKAGISLTYYEFLFYVFCRWSTARNPDYLLLEVGMGGRLDAVNVFDADYVLLPSISRDHQEFLGNRYDLILQEKLGLLRKKTILVSYLSLQYLRERALEITKSIGAEMIDLETFQLTRPWEFSYRNQLLARTAFHLLEGGSQSVLQEKLQGFPRAETFLEHRGDVISSRGEWMFYGSHNVDGVRNLIQFLQSGNYNFGRPPFDAVLVAFSRRDSRDIRAMLKMLKRSGLGPVMVTTFDHPKAALPGVIQDLAELEGIKFVHDVEDHIQKSDDSHRTLVTGSYYFMGRIKQLIRGR